MIRTEEVNQTTQDFLYILACGLSKYSPDIARVKKMEPEKIFSLGKFHTVLAILYMVMEETGVFADNGEWMKQPDTKKLILDWKDKKDKAIRKNLLLDAERSNILGYMEQEGIWYLPLKGIVLKELYPKTGMRQMADNDILYDASYQMQVKNYMAGRGYEVISVGKGNHDVYKKLPVYNFELHTSLYGKVHDKEWVEYYRDVKERLLHTEGLAYGYHFSDEDFYVYIVTHAYKHFNLSGTGIRFLMDIYVFLQKKQEILNWSYINTELTKLKMDKFEKASRILCQKIFSMEEETLTENELHLLHNYLESGTYGTTKINIQKKLCKYQSDGKKINAKTKLKYIQDRIFPNAGWYQDYAPFVYRHSYLKPFFIIFRMVRGVLKKGKLIMREITALRKIKK